MMRTYFDLRFAPNWALIGPAREFLLAFLSVELDDRELASQLSTAAHELMENAVKYSADDIAHIMVAVEYEGRIRLVVENHVDPFHIPALLEEVKHASDATDTLSFYREKMTEAITRTDGKAGLGLARIRCESQMTISCEVEGSVVRIIAERAVDGKPA